MTNQDKRLGLLGAGPALFCALLITIALASGLVTKGWGMAFAALALFAAVFFPALANVLRMRRSRQS